MQKITIQIHRPTSADRPLKRRTQLRDGRNVRLEQRIDKWSKQLKR